VEALFTRGVNYETPDSAAIETHDIASIGEEETFVAELAPSPTAEPHADEVEAVSLESTEEESAPLGEVTDTAAPERKTSSFRALPTPQSRMLGADFLSDVDEDEGIDSPEPEALVADTDVERDAPPTSPLDAAIDPYLRPPRDGSAQEAPDRDDAPRTWPKA
jgi:hypothetical protein